MKEIFSTIGRDHYSTKVSSASKHAIIADEPEDKGGTNLGMAPGELLAASLGACTCITVRMYVDRKEWPLEQINVKVTYERNVETNTSVFHKEIELIGDLDPDQKKRIYQIAEKCPINQTLSNPIKIETVHLS